MKPQFLTVDDVVELHRQSIDLYGGRDGLRDGGLLESAVLAPQQTFRGEFLYESLSQMAAAILHGLVQNHPFVDGNKRTGLRAADVFLAINRVNLAAPSKEATDWTLAVAKGEMSREELAVLFSRHVEPISE
ncbi:MAG: type II toxin-antitoxin system death-on-curing family toxin [Fimbriimonadales bacterium]